MSRLPEQDDTPIQSFEDFARSQQHPSRRQANARTTRGEWWNETQDFLSTIYYPIGFGLFAVFASLQASGVSNDQSQVANQLALLSLCAGNFSSEVCTELLRDPDVYLWEIASSVFNLSRPSASSGEHGANVPQLVSVKDSKFGRADVFMPSYAAAAIVSYFFIVAFYEFTQNLRARRGNN